MCVCLCVVCVFVYFVLLQTLIVFKLHFVCRHLDGWIKVDCVWLCVSVCVCVVLCVCVSVCVCLCILFRYRHSDCI